MALRQEIVYQRTTNEALDSVCVLGQGQLEYISYGRAWPCEDLYDPKILACKFAQARVTYINRIRLFLNQILRR